ncbi:MAG: amidohydrolase family protein [Chloroflexi bacterium]|jgi:5-methylthioadenosine/S-adenosylhomocysteine deaminase|nr:amidohydrolase family protein [Chloroflexota bacterium]
MSTILIEDGSIVTVNDDSQVHHKGYVFIENDLITAVGAGDPPALFRKADTIIDATLMAVMPGMVNAHTHLFQTFIRGLADDKPLLDWLKAAIWPVAQALTEEEAYVAALVGMVENIRGGATSVIDHQYVHTEPGNDDGVCRAADEAGLRFLLARGWADIGYHPAFMESQDQIVNETTRLREMWQIQGNGRIRVEFGPLIPWGCTENTMCRTHNISQKWGAGIHIHVAETRVEVDMNLESRGNRHIEWLAEMGVLGPDMQLVHSIWLDDNEIDLIAEHGAIVVHCPVSNMYLASGVARVPEMLQRGITVALGTDGPGSNNSQDMLETLKTTALLHKVHTLDATILLPEDILWLACRGGSIAFGLPQQIGSLEAGKKADVVLVDLDTPMAMPVHRLPSALVYNASTRDVDTVLVDGRLVMRHKKILFLDEKALLARARRTCANLFERAGVVAH